MAYLTDIERLNYYEGEFLGAVDFQAEQDYQRDMRRRHNVGQHTWGIVNGLDIVVVPTGVTAPGSNLPEVNAYMQPGMAVDGFGREIVVLSKTQLTADLFAAFNYPGALYTTMSVWISYAQVMLNPPTDPCTAANAPNSFGRVQETFALTVTQSGTSPTDDLIVVDGTAMQPPLPPSSGSGAPQPGVIVLPYDDSIPYQEFATDDSSDFWYVQIGQVFWDSISQTLVQPTGLSVAAGRQYAGNVSAEIYVPGGALTIKDRFTPSLLPAGLPPGSIGVAVTVEGSLTVDSTFNAQQQALIGGPLGPNDPGALSPLTIIAAGTTNEELIQFRNPSRTETWLICENLDGNNPGLHFGEIDNKNPPPGATRLILASGGNVGVGTPTPQQNLSVNGGLNIDQANVNSAALSPGLTFGSTSGEGIASNRTKSGANQFGLDFYTNSTVQASVTNTGLLGVGTTTPRCRVGIRGFLQTEELLSFEDGNGTTRWHLNQNRPGPARGLNFAETGVADFRFFLQAGGNVGIGTQVPQQNLSVNGGLNIDQANLNPGSTISPGLTFGSSSGEGIASCRTPGANQFGLDFYTNFQKRMSINNAGVVATVANLTAGSSPINMQPVPQPGSLTVNGNRTLLLGTDQSNWHWIMAGGTTEFGGVSGNNALGFSYDSNTGQGWILTNQNWNLYVGGTIGSGGGKGGYVVDRFITRKGQKFGRGDVVVVHQGAVTHYYGIGDRIPILEVEIADKPADTRVCGVIDEPSLSPNALRDLDATKVDTSLIGQMVTLGAYAHCKADAGFGAITPGDLLTTSSTPGHAQKVSADGVVPPGAIIGKALGPLKKGKGLIPILVSHQ